MRSTPVRTFGLVLLSSNLATIYPFQPYRYTAAAGDINNLVTQPYDKISPAMQARYLSLSPNNLVRVLLGERFPTDNDTNNVYTRAANHLKEWTDKAILAKETEPSLYVYFQEFTLPDSHDRLTRKGFIGLGKLEDYSANIVHRHEQTLSGPKKDRTELLNHTRSHYGQIFMLYPDPDRAVDQILEAEAASRKPDVLVTDEYGAIHRLWKISDPKKIADIQKLMSDKKLLIADGHHRYETALGYSKAHPELEDAKAVMMSFVNMYSDGLRILATHRAVSDLPGFDVNQLIQKLEKDFHIYRVGSVDDLRHLMEEIVPGKVRVGVVVKDAPKMYVLERDRAKGELDVRILHDYLLRDVLGISDESVRDEKHLKYIRGIEPAVKEAKDGGAQVVFLLQPTPIEDVGSVSFGGGVMPQKSTDFYPKLLSGMTIYRLEK